MALTPQDVAAQVGETAKGILGAAPGVAQAAAAAYIKDFDPPGPIPVVGVEIARAACRRYADNPDAPPGRVAAALESVCRPYLDDIGYGTPPTIKLPFRDGQCAGVLYNLTWTGKQYFSDCSSIDTGGTIGVIGPVTGTFYDNTGSSGGGPPGCPTAPGTAWRVNTGGGVVTILGAGGGVQGSVVSVVRADAVPTNCGNPVPIVTPPGTPAVPDPPGPQPFNPGPGIDIDVDVEIGPTGDITFNIGTGPITIDPFGGGEDGGGEDGGGAPGSGLPPGDIGTAADPVPTDPEGKASGCAPPNSVLVGVKVNIVATPEFGSEYDPLVRRGACYVYMGTEGNLALEPAGVALRSGQMFYAYPDNLTCWEVNANTGYVLQVIPYYRALEPEEV